MVKLRLSRYGRHKLPFYRIVAVDSRVKRDGGYIEQLGTFEPFKKAVKLDKEASLKWLQNGAIPSETVLTILKKEGVYADFVKHRQQQTAPKQ